MDYIKRKAAEIIKENIPELEKYPERARMLIILIVVDIMLLPVYLNNPLVYIISIALHIELLGGLHYVIETMIDVVLEKMNTEEKKNAI